MGQAVMIATGGRIYPPDYSLHTPCQGLHRGFSRMADRPSRYRPFPTGLAGCLAHTRSTADCTPSGLCLQEVAALSECFIPLRCEVL